MPTVRHRSMARRRLLPLGIAPVRPTPAPPPRERAGEARAGWGAGTHHADEPVLVGQRTSAAGHSRGAGDAEPPVDAPTSLIADGPTLPGIEPVSRAAVTTGVPNLTTVGAAPSASSSG